MVPQPRGGADGDVQVGGANVPVRAETVEGDERERLWKLISDGYASFESYKTKMTRTIPAVALRRV